jgi:hypothetical protein
VRRNFRSCEGKAIPQIIKMFHLSGKVRQRRKNITLLKNAKGEVKKQAENFSWNFSICSEGHEEISRQP